MKIEEVKRYLPDGSYDYSLWRVTNNGETKTFAEHREAKIYAAVISGEFYDLEILIIFTHLYDLEFTFICQAFSFSIRDFTESIEKTLFLLMKCNKEHPKAEFVSVTLDAFYRIIL